MKKVILTCALAALLGNANAAQVIYDLNLQTGTAGNGNPLALLDESARPIPRLVIPFFDVAADIELGFYSNATPSNPFAGSWVSMNETFTFIGPEDGILDNTYQLVLNDTTSTLPAIGTPLAVRFYNGNLDSVNPRNQATHYNTVSSSNASWQFVAGTDYDDWKANGTAPAVLNLTIDTDSIFESGSSGAFVTVIPIPEASTAIMLSLASCFVLARRKR